MNDFTPITIERSSTPDERQLALKAMYQQVLERQPYDSERMMLRQLEEDFLKGRTCVRRFLKELGCSDLYLDAFYFETSNVKFLDVCFKHFLGRAVVDSREMHFYDDILLKQGVQKLIQAMLDSEEYRKVYGSNTVPYPRHPEQYDCPEAFLEDHLVQGEHFGQRGHTLPTMYWRQLGLNCDGGTCAPAGQAPVAKGDTAPDSMSVGELIELLKSSTPARAKEVVASLSPQQREVLRQAIHA